MDRIKEENLHLKLELEHRMNILRQENEILKKELRKLQKNI